MSSSNSSSNNNNPPLGPPSTSSGNLGAYQPQGTQSPSGGAGQYPQAGQYPSAPSAPSASPAGNQPGQYGQPPQSVPSPTGNQQAGQYGQPPQQPQAPGQYGQQPSVPSPSGPGQYGQPPQQPQAPGQYGQQPSVPSPSGPGQYGQPPQQPQAPGQYGQQTSVPSPSGNQPGQYGQQPASVPSPTGSTDSNNQAPGQYGQPPQQPQAPGQYGQQPQQPQAPGQYGPPSVPSPTGSTDSNNQAPGQYGQQQAPGQYGQYNQYQPQQQYNQYQPQDQYNQYNQYPPQQQYNQYNQYPPQQQQYNQYNQYPQQQQYNQYNQYPPQQQYNQYQPPQPQQPYLNNQIVTPQSYGSSSSSYYSAPVTLHNSYYWIEYPITKGYVVDSEVVKLERALTSFISDKSTMAEILGSRNYSERQLILQKYNRNNASKPLAKQIESSTMPGHLRNCLLGSLLTPLDFDVEQLYYSMLGAGTNESVLINILVTRSDTQKQQIKAAYNLKYPKTLNDWIISDTSGSFQKICIALLSPRQHGPVDMYQVENESNKLYYAGEGKIGTDSQPFIDVFTQRSFEYIKAIAKHYEANHKKHSLEKAIKSEFSGSIKKTLLSILDYAHDPMAYFATCFRKSLKGLGTKDAYLIMLLISQEYDLYDICQTYFKKFGRNLATDIEKDTSGDYRKFLIKFVNHPNPKTMPR